MIGWPSVRSLSTVISLVFSGFGLVSLDQNPSQTPGYNLYSFFISGVELNRYETWRLKLDISVTICKIWPIQANHSQTNCWECTAPKHLGAPTTKNWAYLSGS